MWQQIISGLQAGSWYSLMALAIVLVLKATDVPNFAMAELGLFPAFCTWALIDGAHLSWWLAVPIGLLIGVALSVVVERTAIRPILAENHFATVLMTIAVFVVINAVVQLVWGSEPRKIDSPFAGSFTVAGQVVAYEQLLSIAAGLAVMAGLILFFRTPLGVRMQAIAEDRVTPRLLGVSVTTVFRTSWALAGAIATIALLLQGQASLLTDQNGSGLLIKGFVAATLGGFSSITGAFVGGLALGVAENLAGAYISTSSKTAIALLAIVVVLSIKPQGLFGRHQVREV
ncbi:MULTISPECIES: branched-chain amino acid ABC transporter permease [Nonomuraea]|uniref:Branched-chain amino acid ABC transporter permease n=1 Tax=Nonomuraea ferruginea TaxID=46174 RepID=A0ABT4TCN7_9ACTN|nr:MULTISPECIES: branched-chain amino acid ABC transporter permease [Nonomuraea]MDA0647014.1 branched-chain amino acid ABC transporter permease [Nonomuraea ferruginea]TXK40313.1 branched-chain amino acid ABC transporter permease [Nonomuraea sp. C10]